MIMSIGIVKNVVVCVPVASANAAQKIVCPPVGAQLYQPQQFQAYLIDSSQQNNIDAALGQFDYAYAAQLWSFSFSMIVGLYLFSHGIGLILGMIRRG